MYERTRDEGFGAEVKRRIMLGTYVLSAGYYDAYYLKAQQVRTLLRQDYERAFATVDVVAMPTTPTPAFRLGEKTDDPLQMYLADVFTVSANLAGLPAISVPCGFSPDRLPIGLQLTGRMFDEVDPAARGGCVSARHDLSLAETDRRVGQVSGSGPEHGNRQDGRVPVVRSSQAAAGVFRASAQISRPSSTNGIAGISRPMIAAMSAEDDEGADAPAAAAATRPGRGPCRCRRTRGRPAARAA